ADGLVRFNGTSWSALAPEAGTLASITSGTWVHDGELITNGRLEHPDGSVSNWRRYGPLCPFGDITGAGVVGIQDLLLLLASWGAGPLPCPSDLDGDGAVGITDLLALLSNWS